MEAIMNAFAKALLVGAGTLTLTATSVSAAVVCNNEGDCWHVRGRPQYEPALRLQIHPDHWRWSESEHYRWREHRGRGYWRGGNWIEIN
jgi:hypothetical protein